MPASENFDATRISANGDLLFGIRISLPTDDTFANLVGADWTTTRWYASEQERDSAFGTIGARHPFSRIGDEPTLHYEKISRRVSDVTD